MSNPFLASTFRRQITWLLVIKLILLVVLKIAFFSDPPPKGPDVQARHLLGTVAPLLILQEPPV